MLKCVDVAHALLFVMTLSLIISDPGLSDGEKLKYQKLGNRKREENTLGYSYVNI